MIEWNPVAQDRQARKAAQEAEEIRREAEAELEYLETHCAYCDAHEADPVGCPECRAENFGGTD